MNKQGKVALSAPETKRQLNATGIQVEYAGEGRWSAYVEFSTWDFFEAGNAGVEGRIGTTSVGDLSNIIDIAKRASDAIGVVFVDQKDLQPTIYVLEDGSGPVGSLPPDWRTLIASECRRLGWEFIYPAKRADSSEAPVKVQ